MTISGFRRELLKGAFAKILQKTALAAVCVFLVACSEEVVRTEAEYINIATEAHAAGDSQGALFELGSGIRHFPKNPDLQVLRGKIFLDLEDGAAAEIAFDKAISLGYNPDYLKHDMAQAWLYQRNPAKVIDRLEKEIEAGSKDALVYEIVGRAYIALRDRSNPALFGENMARAEDYIEQAYRLNPESTQVLTAKAWLAAMAGELDDAIGWLDRADSIVKNQRQTLAIKGELLVRKREIDQAQKIYARLVEKYPQYPQYKLELGNTYFLNKEYAEARKWIGPVVRQYPAHLRASHLLANVALMEKQYEEAKELSESVLAKSPDDLQIMIISGASSYFLNDFENAHQKLTHFYNKTGSIAALKLLAATKLKLGEDQQAAELLKNAGQTTELQTDAELLNLVAVASARIGRTDTALKAYKQLSESAPAASSYKLNMALLQISRSNYDEGFKNLESALQQENSEKEPGQNLYTLASKAMQVRQYDRAADYIERYKKAAPDSYKPWVMSAVLQSTFNNPAAVRQEFDKAIELAPDVAETRARYAIFEKMQGNEEKALELAGAALRLDPSNIGAGKLMLEQLIQQKKFDQIQKIVGDAVADKKAPAFSKMIFADYYTLLGQPQDTLNVLAKLPAALRKTATYQITSGKAYLRTGQAERAVAIFENVALTNADNIAVLRHLLHGYLLTGNQRKYQLTLEKIDRLSPNDYDNQYELAKLYISTAKFNLAGKMLRDINPANPEQTLQKKILQATMEMNRGRFRAAQEILQPLHRLYPQNGAVAMLYARSLANDKQTAKAIGISKTWANQHPDNLEVKKFLADLYLRQNDRTNARMKYQEILAAKEGLTPDSEIHAHNNLAVIFLAENQGEKALAHAQKAFDMAPNVAAVVDTFARVLMAQGQTEKALDHFNQALALLPGDDRQNRSIFTLGKARALIKSGDRQQAERILKRLVKEDPGFSEIEDARKLLADIREP